MSSVPPPSPLSPADELRLLVRRARLLVAAEREGGVLDLPGTPAPPAEDLPDVRSVRGAPAREPAAPEPVRPRVRAAPALPEAGPAPAVAHPPPPEPVAAAADASAGDAAEPAGDAEFAPRVRALDLPPDVLAPFGTLPAEVAACRRCRLCETRTHTVFGEGTATAQLVFCGEGPGFEEDRSGRPFVGKSGELLTAMIEKGLRLRREDVFILNAVKCRPPGNRTPAPDEIAACRPFLERQLAVIRPRVIVALGNPACKALLGNVRGIMSIRGQVFDAWNAKVVPTFHPSYLIRTPGAKADAWKDLKLVLQLLAEPG